MKYEMFVAGGTPLVTGGGNDVHKDAASERNIMSFLLYLPLLDSIFSTVEDEALLFLTRNATRLFRSTRIHNINALEFVLKILAS